MICINSITRQLDLDTAFTAYKNAVSSDKYGKVSDSEQIQTIMVEILKISFENNMYDKDNPMSPYHELKW